MQNVPCDARKPGETSARIEVAGNRQRARGAQFRCTFRMMRERDHARSRGAGMEKRQRAQPDIAASDDQHARAAQNSSGDHAEHCIRRSFQAFGR